MGISSYKVKQFLDCVVAEFDQKEKRWENDSERKAQA